MFLISCNFIIDSKNPIETCKIFFLYNGKAFRSHEYIKRLRNLFSERSFLINFHVRFVDDDIAFN